jgi:hypothetical protein
MEKSDEAMLPLPTEKGEKSKHEKRPLDAEWLSRDYKDGVGYWGDQEETPTKKVDLGKKRRASSPGPATPSMRRPPSSVPSRLCRARVPV